MRIQELEQRTSLDRATIRYYEREGLINPKRNENGYREYVPEDVQQLLKIKLLRKLEMPIEQIRQLQQGSGDFEKAIETQMILLGNRIGEKTGWGHLSNNQHRWGQIRESGCSTLPETHGKPSSRKCKN